MKKFQSWISKFVDVKAFRGQLHHFVLIGVSAFVFYKMEGQLDKFSKQVKSSMSEREFEQQQTYNQIMQQIKDYDGSIVPLQEEDDQELVYKHELVKPWLRAPHSPNARPSKRGAVHQACEENSYG